MPTPREKEDVTVKLISQFKELLATGALTPGCKLPPERELAKRFGISRPSLRQALKVLEIMGVLFQRVGDGTYLNKSASAILDQPMDFLVLMGSIAHSELFEARLIVEPELAARAAERATNDDLAALKKALVAMRESRNDISKLVEADLAFHDAVFQAAGNRVCHLMFKMIHRAILSGIAWTVHFRDFRDTLKRHENIYEAIYNRKPEEARQAMTEHLLDAKSTLLSGEKVYAPTVLAEKITPITSGRSAGKSKRGQTVAPAPAAGTAM